MSVLDDVKQVLHRIRVKLYPCHLPGKEDELVARTVEERTLSVEEVCVAARDRGGFTGSLEDLIEHVKIFLRESARQLCDGYGVNFGGLFVIFANLGGVFLNERDPVDPEKHKVNFHFRVLAALRRLADTIEIINEGLADTEGYIAEITDVTTGLVNDEVTKGGIGILTGNKVKIVEAGTGRKAGVFFCQPGTPNVSIGVSGKFAVNNPAQIIFTIPELLAGNWYVEARTYYSGTAGHPLKELRAIRSTFTVKQA